MEYIFLKNYIYFTRSSLCGTIDYLCPEILKKESYDNKIDIWCLGVLLYELCAGYPPFYAKDPKEKVQNILNMKWEFPKNISFSPELKNLINLLLQEQPKNRPEISEIFEHSWMLMHYSLYNMDKEEALYLSFNRLFNKNNDLCSISNDQNESLYLKESILTSEYLKINGIEDLLHLNLKNIKQNSFLFPLFILRVYYLNFVDPCNYDQKFAKLKKSNKSSGSSESNLSYRNASYRNLRTDSPINKYKSNSPNKNVFTFEDSE